MDKLEKFKTWLTKRGAVVLTPTNEWEVVRFRTANGVSVVYKNKHEHLTFTGESEKAYGAYKANKPWRAVDRKRQQLRAKKAKLATRDGKKCFACFKKLGFDELTIEHILSFSHGGTDNDNNLCLLCEPCNKAMGNMPVVNKIEMIIQRRHGFGLLDEVSEIQEFTLAQDKAFTFSTGFTNGDIVRESTPKGDNYFYKLFHRKKKS